MRWSATRSLPVQSNPLYAVASDDGLKVIYARIDTGAVKFSKSLDEGSSFAAETAPGITADDVQLDRPLAYDLVTGRLHLLYSQQVDAGALPAKLCHRYSDDDSATWSSETVLDSGSTYGNNHFYRASISARNGVVNVDYSSHDNSTFVIAGQFLRRSTDGGATFGTKTEPWGTGLNGGRPELVAVGATLHVVFTFNTNSSGNGGIGAVYYSRSTDKGATWSTAIQLTSNTTAQRPFIVGESGDLVAIYQAIAGADPGFTLYSRHSGDNGVTWDSEVTIKTGASASQEHSYAAQHGKYAGVVWTDWSTTPHSFRAKFSSDAGVSWGAEETPFTSSGDLAAGRIVGTKRGMLALCGNAASGATAVLASRKAMFLAPGGQTDQALPVIDDFSAYTNNQSLNAVGNWTLGPMATNSLKGTGTGAAKRTSAAGTFDRSGSYRSDVTYTGNCEGYVTCLANADGELNLYFVTTGGNGYSVNNAGGTFGSETSIWRNDAGASTVLIGDSRAMVIGDKIKLQLVGTQIPAYRFDVSSGDWQELGCPVDNTYRASLRLALEIAGSAQVPNADDIGGGVLLAPVGSASAVISGTQTVGAVLSVSTGGWLNLPDRYTYQWQRDGSAITDETLPFYTVQAADIGHTITNVVTASNPVGSASVTAGLADPNAGAVRPLLTRLGF